MAIKVPIRIRGDKSDTGLEAERVFDLLDWYLLHNKNLNSLKLIVARALEYQELNYLEWLVMKYISVCDDDVTISSIALKFDFNVPQTTVLVKKLIKRNLVKYKVSIKDRRVKILRCTRRGTKLTFEGDQAIQHVMRYWLFDLTDKQLAEYDQIIRKISNFEIPPYSIK